MFTRSELEIKTINELRDLCRRYGIKPTGNAGYKTSYITYFLDCIPGDRTSPTTEKYWTKETQL